MFSMLLENFGSLLEDDIDNNMISGDELQNECDDSVLSNHTAIQDENDQRDVSSHEDTDDLYQDDNEQCESSSCEDNCNEDNDDLMDDSETSELDDLAYDEFSLL